MNESILLYDSLDPNRILLNSDIKSRKKLLQTMASLLATGADSEAVEKEIYQSLWEREKLGNTGIGNGIALPHSRCAKIKRAIVAVISTSEGVDYDAIDNQEVDLAFGLLVPEEATQDHLNLLAQIAKLFSDPSKKTKLKSAESAERVLTLVQNWMQE